MTVTILANGEFPRKEYPLWLLRSADAVVCCDGAYGRKLKKMGVNPVAVVGDMDSLPSALKKNPEVSLVRVDEQEFNDLNKAMLWVLDNYAQVTDIHILGATGKSEAHALGNLSYLMYWEQEHKLSECGIRVEMVSDYNTAFVVADSCELHVGEGRKVSLFSTDPALRIHSEGLRWQTDAVRFDFWFRGTLNRASADIISLRFNHPAPVLVILD